MKRIYVAGPIGVLDEGRPARLRAAVLAGCDLLKLGFAPFVPHLWAAAMEHGEADAVAHYEHWMEYDFEWLDTCCAVLRIPGVSPGADREVERAKAYGMPVFCSVEALVEHARAHGWISQTQPMVPG